MIGNGHWATGITVAWAYAGGGDYGWAAEVDYLDAGFCDDVPGTSHISTEGTLRTRYAVRDTEDGESSLASVLDVIKADAERLGICWREPHLYYKGEIYDEYGKPVTAAEMIGWVEGKRGGRNDVEPGHGYLDADGNRFIAEWFS